jgi:hypothetical protein
LFAYVKLVVGIILFQYIVNNASRYNTIINLCQPISKCEAQILLDAEAPFGALMYSNVCPKIYNVIVDTAP